jgi:hypothetical protein
MILGALVGHTVDVALDFYVAYLLWEGNERSYALTCIMIVALNAILGAMLSYRVHNNSLKSFILGLILIEPYIAGIESITKNHGRKTKEYALQRLFEVLIEAAPQAIFQLYIAFVGVEVFSDKSTGVLYFSIAMSLCSVACGVFMYEYWEVEEWSKVRVLASVSYVRYLVVLLVFRFVEVSTSILVITLFAFATRPNGLWIFLFVDTGFNLLVHICTRKSGKGCAAKIKRLGTAVLTSLSQVVCFPWPLSDEANEQPMKTFYFYQSIKMTVLIVIMHHQYVQNIQDIKTSFAEDVNQTTYWMPESADEVDVADLRVVEDHKFLYAAMWFFLLLFVPLYMLMAPLRRRVYKKRAKYRMSNSPTKEAGKKIGGVEIPALTERNETGHMADMLLGSMNLVSRVWSSIQITCSALLPRFRCVLI